MTGAFSGRTLVILAGAATTVAVVAAIYLETPSEARARRLDERRVKDLVTIESTVKEYWNRRKELPPSLGAIAGTGLQPPLTDPESQAPYRYSQKGAESFELCATFARASDKSRGDRPVHDVRWAHGSGLTCFDRSVKSRGS
jgi:hypothetical protein